VSEDYPINLFLQIVLAMNELVGERTGIEPLLSAATYSYGISTPTWDWAQVGKKIQEAESALDALPPDRAAYLREFLKAFALMTREGQGEKIPYADRVATYVQVPGERVPAAVIKALESELCDLVVEAGYPDDLSIALAQWRESQTLRGEALEREAHTFLRQARADTNQRVLPLPEEHQVVLAFPENYPYRGYSDYSRDYQGRVFLNGDIGWERASLKHLIYHEVFPGHQAFSAIREQRYRDGVLPVEGTVYFGNTPMTPIVEGICEVGQEILSRVENIDDRIYDVYNRFSSAVSTNLAFDCNADGMDKETAVTLLMDTTHVSRIFAEKRYHFWTNPLWCTSFPHYWYGRELIRESYLLLKDQLPTLFRMVYIEPHTVRSFRDAIKSCLNRDGDSFADGAEELANSRYGTIGDPQ
jgi:hypothetical protein